MKKIELSLTLTEVEWEVLVQRARKALPAIKQELGEDGESYSIDDAIKTEIACIISSDIETYDIYDDVRHSATVKSAIRQALKKHM